MRRYDGNTGRYVYVPDVQREPKQNSRETKAEPVRKLPDKTEPLPNGFGSGIQKLFFNLFSRGFETEDLLLFAILFLMYQETKDKELLIIMGGMFLL